MSSTRTFGARSPQARRDGLRGGRLRRQGLTLVEVLLAVFLLALMMAIVYGVVTSTIRSQQRMEEVLAGSEIGPAIMNQIRQDLEAAFVPDKEKDWFFGVSRPGPSGDRDRVDFIAGAVAFGAEDAQSEPRFHSINEVGYTVLESREHAGEGVLYRREDYWLDAEPLKGGRLVELHNRVRTFDVQYYDGSQWVSDWSSKKAEGKLPQAMKVVLKIMVEDRLAEGGLAERTFALSVSTPQ